MATRSIMLSLCGCDCIVLPIAGLITLQHQAVPLLSFSAQSNGISFHVQHSDIAPALVQVYSHDCAGGHAPPGAANNARPQPRSGQHSLPFEWRAPARYSDRLAEGLVLVPRGDEPESPWSMPSPFLRAPKSAASPMPSPFRPAPESAASPMPFRCLSSRQSANFWLQMQGASIPSVFTVVYSFQTSCHTAAQLQSVRLQCPKAMHKQMLQMS